MLLDKKKVSRFTTVFAALLAIIFIVGMIGPYLGSSSPTTLGGLIQEANKYQDNGQYKEAANDYEQVLKQDPNNVDVRVDLAISYYAQQTPQTLQSAISNVKKAIEINPNHPKAHYNLGVFYKTSGDNGNARKEFLTYLKLDPNGDSAYQAKQELANLTK
ncbi:MAG: tetratricopeptide repeat protein [Chloroflexi bacterium]|nr:tetratricopeptide repeat protein [Chloroflexota bacterium]